jgi:hypothetical protein
VPGTCTVTVTASGDNNIRPATSGPVSWTVVNTKFPQLALVSPLTKGLKPSFVFSSTQSSLPGTFIEVLGSCGPAPVNQAAILGNNTFQLKQLILGATYSDCQIRVTNDVGSGILDLPAFTVTENLNGPGGVGGTDGTSALRLWLNGETLTAADGTAIPVWADQSGWGNTFFAATGGGTGLSPADPFITIQNARDRVTVAGIYYFNLTGTAFSTYVDAQGYVLIASAKSSTNGSYTTTTDLALQSDQVLQTAILSKMDVNEVRMNVISGANAGFNVTSTNATIIAEAKAGNQFPNPNDLGTQPWQAVPVL